MASAFLFYLSADPVGVRDLPTRSRAGDFARVTGLNRQLNLLECLHLPSLESNFKRVYEALMKKKISTHKGNG